MCIHRGGRGDRWRELRGGGGGRRGGTACLSRIAKVLVRLKGRYLKGYRLTGLVFGD